eukprot:2505162-Prymnesium_polylepis.1
MGAWQAGERAQRVFASDEHVARLARSVSMQPARWLNGARGRQLQRPVHDVRHVAHVVAT